MKEGRECFALFKQAQWRISTCRTVVHESEVSAVHFFRGNFPLSVQWKQMFACITLN